jgi:hypothetical protein
MEDGKRIRIGLIDVDRLSIIAIRFLRKMDIGWFKLEMSYQMPNRMIYIKTTMAGLIQWLVYSSSLDRNGNDLDYKTQINDFSFMHITVSNAFLVLTGFVIFR